MTLRLNGSTSGFTEIDAPAVAGSNTLVLPTGAGSANQFLKNGSTAGSLGWSSLVEDSSGRLLVGTSSSIAAGSVTASILQVSQGASGVGATLYSLANASGPGGILVLGHGRATAAGLLSSGDVVGQVRFAGGDGGDLVTLAAQISVEVDGTPGANDMPGRLVFSTTADGASSPTERMRINSAGRVFINGTTEYALTTVSFPGSTAFGLALQNSDAGAASQISLRFMRNVSDVGSITTTNTATAYNTSSDYRLKENVTAVTDGITRLQQLKPSRFNFIADPGQTVDGFIAHEAQDVVPEAVTGAKDAVDADGNPVYQGIDQSKLVPLLTAALQEAIAKIESLEARLTALEVTP